MRPIIKSISPASISIPGQSMAIANAEMERLRLQARIAASGGSLAGGVAPPASAEYLDVVAADNPIAWYRFDEVSPSGSGSILDYSTGGTYDGTPTGGITWQQAGPITDGLSKSALFNGTDGRVNAGSALAAALMGSSTWTIEMWFNSGRNNGGYLFAAAADASNRVAIQHFNNIIFTSSSLGGNKSSGTNALGGPLQTSWHHLVLRSDGALYINGVAQSGTGSSPLSSTVDVVVGARNDNTNFFQGRISHVVMYNTLLSEARILAHRDAGVKSRITNGRTFYWDMETGVPNVFPAGTDDSPSYDQGSSLSNLQAFAGTQSLSVGGATFRAATFNNPTNQDHWTRLTEGYMRCRVRFNGAVTEFMAFQITGKDRTGVNDTNDSVQVRFTSSAVSLLHGGNGGASTTTLSAPVSLAADTWHYIEARWRQVGSPTLSLTINGTEYTSSSALTPFNCNAWHHLLIGNDRNATPTGMWVDEFEAFGSWAGA